MTGSKCKSCGSSELEVDPSRGDTVCTNCGTVLEDSVIVSEMQFEANARGGSSAIGQFVSADSSGGCRGFGHSFHSGAVKESRDITLQNAKRGISNLCQQLRLNQHCMDTAFNFYKMALSRHLTRGRKHTHVLAACLYITCRIEGTPHLLIDLSDILQICAFELGRTYLRLSQALCINVPSVDPCLYVLRFANKLEFGEKTHEVTMTAMRVVQRMKRDSMHSGRRPSGICGAALLMAARMHGYNRTVGDVIKVVQVHESTLRKRLMEFGETPSSSLTLQEFLTVDLEEEQDPPSYRAARARDSERLKVLNAEENEKQLSQLQYEIEAQLFDKKKRKLPVSGDEEEDTDRFVVQSTLGVLENYIQSESSDLSSSPAPDLSQALGPTIASMGLRSFEAEECGGGEAIVADRSDGELDTEGLDDAEIDSYIMTESEASQKDIVWHQLNAPYLNEKKEKEERLKKEREEGKPEKKRRLNRGRKAPAPANSAGEAIEKMLQEKKISTKINYDVLKSLSMQLKAETEAEAAEMKLKLEPKVEEGAATEVKKEVKKEDLKKEEVTKVEQVNQPEIYGDDDDYEEEAEEGERLTSLAEMLNQHREDDSYYSYDEDDY